MDVDEIDRELLKLLMRNARISYKDMAAHTDLTAPPVRDRISKLEENDVIKGYHAEIDYSALGYRACGLVGISTRNSTNELTNRVLEFGGVTEVLGVSGEWSLVARVRAQSDSALNTVRSEIAALDEVTGTELLVIFDENQSDGLID